VSGSVPEGGFTVTMTSPKEAQKMGLPHLSDTERRTPIHAQYAYQQFDTLPYILPKGVTIEMPLKDVELLTDYGKYERKTVL